MANPLQQAPAGLPMLAAVLDGVSRPVIIRDSDLNYIHANKAACDLLGVTLHELLLSTAYDLTPKEEVDAFQAIDRNVLASGRPYQSEESLTLRGGSRRRLQVCKWCMEDPAWPDRRLLITELTDITELREAEERLRLREEHYRSFIDLHPHVPWVGDANGGILETSPAWSRATGLTVEQALGHGWIEALHPDDHDRVLAAVSECASAGQPFDVEMRMRTPDGGWRWHRSRGVPRRNPQGEIDCWFGLMEDVDDRHATLDALRESEALFRSLADDAPAMIWTWSAENIDDCYQSRKWYELTGLTEEDVRANGWISAVHPDDAPGTLARFKEIQSNPTVMETEYRLRRADGTYARVVDFCKPRFSDSGQFLGYVGTAFDITTRYEERETQALIQSLFENSPDGLRLIDTDLRLILSNPTAQRLFGAAASEPGATLADHLPPADFQRIVTSVPPNWSSPPARLNLTLNGDRPTPVEVILAPVRGEGDRPARYLSIWRDVSGVRAAQAEAAEAADRLLLVLESMAEAVVVVEANGDVSYLNHNARHLFSCEAAETLHLNDLFPPTSALFHTKFEEVRRSRTPTSFEASLKRIERWLAVTVTPTGDGISIFLSDITERRQAEYDNRVAQQKIEHMSLHDALTGLPNRIQFRDRLDRALRIPQSQPAILSLDLDGFKAVNDAYGHPSGDVLLRHVSSRLRGCLRTGETAARLGGDEFSIVQAHVTKPEDTIALAQRIISRLSQPYDLGGIEVVIGVSIGIAFAAEAGRSADDMIKAADIALYRAKDAGRGTWSRFTNGMEAELKARAELKAALHRAFLQHELELHYQPLVNLRGGHISSFEALLRWNHPERGLIPPSDFVPLAEESGLIRAIGDWVLRTACTEAMNWPDPITVAVNLSVLQFRSGNLPECVALALRDSGLPATRLQLEITESVLLDDDGANLRALRQLREMGIRVTIDDFGTGYSSLSYLHRFPFDKIKVDRSFVNEMPGGRESKAVLRAVAGLGKSLGIVTTVEGVETELQLAAVTSEGFDEAQGFFFSPPMTGPEVQRKLSALQQISA